MRSKLLLASLATVSLAVVAGVALGRSPSSRGNLVVEIAGNSADGGTVTMAVTGALTNAELRDASVSVTEGSRIQPIDCTETAFYSGPGDGGVTWTPSVGQSYRLYATTELCAKATSAAATCSTSAAVAGVVRIAPGVPEVYRHTTAPDGGAIGALYLSGSAAGVLNACPLYP